MFCEKSRGTDPHVVLFCYCCIEIVAITRQLVIGSSEGQSLVLGPLKKDFEPGPGGLGPGSDRRFLLVSICLVPPFGSIMTKTISCTISTESCYVMLTKIWPCVTYR
jgi:hypothetical protein